MALQLLSIEPSELTNRERYFGIFLFLAVGTDYPGQEAAPHIQG
jgi:hypothetical protein